MSTMQGFTADMSALGPSNNSAATPHLLDTQSLGKYYMSRKSRNKEDSMSYCRLLSGGQYRSPEIETARGQAAAWAGSLGTHLFAYPASPLQLSLYPNTTRSFTVYVGSYQRSHVKTTATRRGWI